MIISSIYRASQKKRLSPTLCSFAHSVIEPLSLDSPADCKTTTISHHPRVYCKRFETLNGRQQHLWIKNYEFSKEKQSHCYSMIQQMSTSSHVVKETTITGKVSPPDKNELTIQSTWIDKYIPSSARPYAYLARLDKPIGIWLLAWPCMCQVLGASSLPLVATYPFTKRFTYGVRLSFTFIICLGNVGLVDYVCGPVARVGLMVGGNWLLGWSAVKGSLDPIIVLPLYLSGVFWTLVYDTIYAHQDKEDDKKVGVKSTALLFEDRTKYWVSGFGSACISSLLLSGYNAEIGWPFYVFVMAASGQLAWQIWTVDLSRPADCNKKFSSNKWFGAIVFSGILIGKLSS
ncbi:4-hydroxybenzoate polyprenyltransferase [Ranunculus cassubicifolius]